MPTDRFRRKRMGAFSREFPLAAGMRVLDVGGTPLNWVIVDPPAEVLLLNIDVPPDGAAAMPPNVRYVRGDGTALAFSDGEFDVCFSNSTDRARAHLRASTCVCLGAASRWTRDLAADAGT